MAGMCSTAQAVPAFPGRLHYTQPDGTVVTYYLRGDEHCHWLETIDGHLLQRAADGYLKYATIDGDSLRASALPYTGNDAAAMGKMKLLSHSNLPKGITPKAVGDPSLSHSQSFPTTGNRRLLMLLVDFADTQTIIPSSDFDNMMNASGYNGIGSFRDYYLENSYGALNIETTVVGWIKLPSNKSAYSTTDMTALISDAINAINDEIDFTQFDNDGDGILDGLSIVHQGYGQEVSGSYSDIWSHSGDLLSEVYADGVKVQTYTIQPELLSDNTQMTVGVFCHEFGHNLGAPDFYDANYEQDGSFIGTGEWDIMSGGSWSELNTPGDCPTHFNMWQKMQYGWVEPQYLTESCSVTDIPSATEQAVGYIMNTQREGDYFVIENRTQTSFDRTLPGSGIIIYHADESRIRSSLQTNTVNTDYNQGLYTVCASATTDPGTTPASYGDIDSDGAPFPGSYGVTEFSDATTPSAHSNDGKYSYMALRNIVADGGTASFDFVKGETPATVRNFSATAQRGIVTLSWEAPEQDGVQTYRIFRDDVLIHETRELQYVDNGLLSTVATYKVDVLYSNGLYSPFVTSSVRVPDNKVTSAASTTNSDGDVELTWQLNTTLTRINTDINTAAENAEITSINSTGEVVLAHRFRAQDLSAYVGYTFSSISFWMFSSYRQVPCAIRIYRAAEGGTPEVVSERDAADYAASRWNQRNLRTPVTIEKGYDYYVAIAANSTLGYVSVAFDTSTHDEGLGDLACVDGEWQSELLDGNVLLYATLTPADATQSDFVNGEQPAFDDDYDPVADASFPIGFNVYRDGELVGFTSSRIFIDNNVVAGNTYTYGIACLYQGNNESRLVETTVNVGSSSVDDASSSNASVVANGMAIDITSPTDGMADIYTTDGVKIASAAVAANSTQSIGIADKGLYIVKLFNKNDISIYKIIIR